MRNVLAFVFILAFGFIAFYSNKNIDHRSEFLQSSELIAEAIVAKMEIQNLRSLAISNFESVDGENKKVGEFLANRLASDLTKLTSHIQIINREKIGQILEELDLKTTGALDKNTVLTKGKMIGIDGIVIGKQRVTKNFFGTPTSLNISLELIDIERGVTIYANTVNIEDFKEVHPYCIN